MRPGNNPRLPAAAQLSSRCLTTRPPTQLPLPLTSSTARPSYDAYHYDKLQSDILSIVDESGLSTPFDDKFHIVAHDQGARVVWHSIAVGSVAERLLSFASLSIPHADVFSDSIYGDNTDPDEKQAAQYFRQLILPNSTTGGPADNNEIWNSVCLPTDYDTKENCQKGLWWYNGAIDAGAFGTMQTSTPHSAPALPCVRYFITLRSPELTLHPTSPR